MMAKKEILFLDRKEAPYTNMVQLNHQTRQNFVVNSTHCSKNGEADVKGFQIGFAEIANKSLLIRLYALLAMDRMWMCSSIKTTQSHSISLKRCSKTFEKESVQTTIRNFQMLKQRQDDQEIRAIYGAGSYRYLQFYVIVFFYYLQGCNLNYLNYLNYLKLDF